MHGSKNYRPACVLKDLMRNGSPVFEDRVAKPEADCDSNQADDNAQNARTHGNGSPLTAPDQEGRVYHIG